MIAWGGQDFLNFWEIQISKKNTSTKCFAFFLVTTLWLQGDSRAKWIYRFFKKSWPLLTVSLISTKINLFVHWYFQRQFGFCWRQSQKKSIFPPRNHYFGVFHIDHHPMHYSITKKHTLPFHVKNIDIKIMRLIRRRRTSSGGVRA